MRRRAYLNPMQTLLRLIMAAILVILSPVIAVQAGGSWLSIIGLMACYGCAMQLLLLCLPGSQRRS